MFPGPHFTRSLVISVDMALRSTLRNHTPSSSPPILLRTFLSMSEEYHCTPVCESAKPDIGEAIALDRDILALVHFSR